METATLVAFNGSQELKDRVLEILTWHREQDRIVQGQYWSDPNDDDYENNAKGCAVGCTLESIRKIEGLKEIDHDRHALYERYLGVPSALAHIEDHLFENMYDDEAQAWPERFIQAIPVGADLSMVIPRFLFWSLSGPDGEVQRYASYRSGTLAFVNLVADLYRRWLDGNKPTESEFAAAVNAEPQNDYSCAVLAAYWSATAAYNPIHAGQAAGACNYEVTCLADKLIELLAAAPVIATA